MRFVPLAVSVTGLPPMLDFTKAETMLVDDELDVYATDATWVPLIAKLNVPES
jgi:hypothetical protein